MASQNSLEIQALPMRDREILQAQYTNPTIQEMGMDLFIGGMWRKKLLFWAELIGLRKQVMLEDGTISCVTDLQEEILCRLISAEYGGLTLQEVDVALKMNLLGEFEEKIKHYNEFNVEYLTQIIAAYKKHRIVALKKYREILYKLNYVEPPVSKKEADYRSGRAIYRKYKDLLSGNKQLGLHVDFIFLNKIGIVSPDEAEMEEAMSFVQQDLKDQQYQDISDSAGIGMQMANIGNKSKDDTLNSLFNLAIEDKAREYLTLQYFESIKSSDGDLQSELRVAILRYHQAITL